MISITQDQLPSLGLLGISLPIPRPLLLGLKQDLPPFIDKGLPPLGLQDNYNCLDVENPSPMVFVAILSHDLYSRQD